MNTKLDIIRDYYAKIFKQKKRICLPPARALSRRRLIFDFNNFKRWHPSLFFYNYANVFYLVILGTYFFNIWLLKMPFILVLYWLNVIVQRWRKHFKLFEFTLHCYHSLQISITLIIFEYHEFFGLNNNNYLQYFGCMHINETN